MSLLAMRLRKVDLMTIVDTRIQLAKAGLDISTAELETHYLAGGNVSHVVQAFIAASNANIDLTWMQATTIDLAGYSVLDAVQTSMKQKGIDCQSR